MARHNEVAESFINRRPATSGAMVATAHEVFSYQECIAQCAGPDSVAVRKDKFSVTTSRHTNAVRRALESDGYRRDPERDTEHWEMWTNV